AKILQEDPTRDIAGVIQDRFTRTPTGVRFAGLEPQIRWLDPQIAQRQKGLDAAFPGRSVLSYGRTEDGLRVLARVSGPASPAVYYLVDYATHKADIVGEEYPGLVIATLGNVRPFKYKA